MIKRHKVQSCCGKMKYVLETSTPIRKQHIRFFEEAGYSIPPNFKEINVFYVRKVSSDLMEDASVAGQVLQQAKMAAARRHAIVATTPFGSNKITVYCGGEGCEKQLNDFEELLERALNS